MTTTTPNLGLTLYDSSTDTSVTFATFRAVWGGPASTSNFYKIDTAYGVQAAQITSLTNTRGAIPVSALFSSANYYVATGITAITAYTAGMTILLNVDTTSNGTVTLNINSLGILSVMKVDSTGTPINLTGSDLVKGRQYLFMYDGARWRWVSANSADQIQIVGTSGNVVTVGTTNNLDGSLTQSLLISNTLHAATAKTTLTGNDEFAISDSAASNILKKITWTNIQTAIGGVLGVVIDALTAKTSPVGTDEIVVGDSSASFATKKVLISNLYKGLGTGTQNSNTFLNGSGAYSIPEPDGWIPITDTWTYASATTITVPTDATLTYQKGYKIRFKQGGAYKYLPLSAVAATLLTTPQNNDYSVANSTITDIWYSTIENPFGWPDWFNYTATVNGTTGSAGTYGEDQVIQRFKVKGKTCRMQVRKRINDKGSWATTVQVLAPIVCTDSYGVTAGQMGGSWWAQSAAVGSAFPRGWASIAGQYVNFWTTIFPGPYLAWSAVVNNDWVFIDLEYPF